MNTLSVEGVEEKLDANNYTVLLNVLPREQFEKEHIPGSVNVPLSKLSEKAEEMFGEDDEIIVYCMSSSCSASEKAAKKLERMDFKNVYDFKGGLKGWKKSGNSTISG